MRKRSVSRSMNNSMAIAADLMLAPLVVAMRMPMMAREVGTLAPWTSETRRAVSEKAAAMTDGMIAAQMSFARSAAGFWPDILSGRTPAVLNGAAAERAMHAALQPAGRKVKANFKRLSRKG